MPVESWITPDDTPAFAAEAAGRIDTALARLTETDRDAFWASVRKCYNTPYNDPKPRRLPMARDNLPGTRIAAPLKVMAGSIAQERSVPGRDVPMAAIPVPGFSVEAHPS